GLAAQEQLGQDPQALAQGAVKDHGCAHLNWARATGGNAMSNSDLAYLSGVEVGGRLARRELSSVELTQAMLERIARLEPKLRSYAAVMGDAALADAKRADAELQQGKRRGPLHA